MITDRPDLQQFKDRYFFNCLTVTFISAHRVQSFTLYNRQRPYDRKCEIRLALCCSVLLYVYISLYRFPRSQVSTKERERPYIISSFRKTQHRDHSIAKSTKSNKLDSENNILIIRRRVSILICRSIPTKNDTPSNHKIPITR